MTDVWEAFGIKSLSPSQLTKWSQCRGLWYASARKKVYEDAGPAAWRGDAVEAGLYAALMGRGASEKTALELFSLREDEYAKKHDGECHPDAEDEMNKIAPTLARAIEACEKVGVPAPTSHNPNTEAMLPGVRVKMFGKPDFTIAENDSWQLPAHCVDLKTSNQIPSKPKDGGDPEPKIEHAIAASFYAYARKEKLARILYISTAGNPKETHRLIELDEKRIAFYIEAAARIAKQIEVSLTSALARQEFECISAEDALAELCMPNFLATGGGFFPIWKSEYANTARAAVPAWRMNHGA